VAFPRTNVVPASPARETVGAVALAAERRADVRSSVEFMMLAIDGMYSIEASFDVGRYVKLVEELWTLVAR
jgi:hypothetical protein